MRSINVNSASGLIRIASNLLSDQLLLDHVFPDVCQTSVVYKVLKY